MSEGYATFFQGAVSCTPYMKARALEYALALMRDRMSVETNANAAVIQGHIYALIELVAERSDPDPPAEQRPDPPKDAA